MSLFVFDQKITFLAFADLFFINIFGSLLILKDQFLKVDNVSRAVTSMRLLHRAGYIYVTA